jgi:hypothetical protein
MSFSSRLEVRLYRAAVYLYPPGFRREFGAEMAQDFLDASVEIRLAGRVRGLWSFRAQIGADFAKTVLVQWLRTGVPIIAVVAAVGPLFIAGALAKWSREVPMILPNGTPDEEVLAVALMAIVVLLIIAATIVFTLWFMRPVLYRTRR